MCLSRQESLPTERSIPVSFALCGLLVPAFQDTACRSEDFFPLRWASTARSPLLSSSFLRPETWTSAAVPFVRTLLCYSWPISLLALAITSRGPLDSGQREGEEAKSKTRGLTQPLLFPLFPSFFLFIYFLFFIFSSWLVGETGHSSRASHQSARPQQSPRTSRRLPSANDSPTNICRFSIRHPSNRPDPLISSLWPTPDPGFAPALKAQPSTSPFLSAARRFPPLWNFTSHFQLFRTLDILLFPSAGTSHSLILSQLSCLRFQNKTSHLLLGSHSRFFLVSRCFLFFTDWWQG